MTNVKCPVCKVIQPLLIPPEADLTKGVKMTCLACSGRLAVLMVGHRLVVCTLDWIIQRLRERETAPDAELPKI